MEFELSKAVEILERTPKAVRAMLEGLSDVWALEPNDPDSWSPFDVVGHFIHGEETDWIPRAKIILAQGENVRFVPFDRFAQFEKSKGRSLADLLDEFEELRDENLKTLEEMNLTVADLDLKGMHPELGEVNMRQLLATWVVHDLNHIRQIAVAMAKKYEGNVGVWKEYLAILD